MVRAHVLVAAAVACGPPPPPKYTVTMPERHARLDNGLRVILLPDASAELVEVDVRYEVGSKEDPPGRAGLAHLVEHLMFQQRQAGPDKPPLGVVLRSSSLYHNAFTTWDGTHYQTMARPDALETLIGLEAARLATGCDTITEKIFLREREVVRNEVRQRIGAPDGQMLVRLLEDLYPEGHPYRRTIGGDDTQLTAITLADVCAFMRAYHVPERVTVIVAGKLDEAEAGRLVARYLGTLPARAGAPLVPVPPLSYEKLPRRRIDREMDLDESSVTVAWPLPPIFGPDRDAIQFLVANVTGRTAAFGSIYEFASDVSPILLGGPSAPVLAVQVTLRGAGDVEEAKDAVFRAAGGAHRGLENDELFDEVRAKLIGLLAMRFEPLAMRGAAYGDYAQFVPGGAGFGGELETLRKLDADRLRARIKSILDPDKAMVVVVKARAGAGGGYRRAAVAAAEAGVPRDELPVDRSEAAVTIPLPERPTRVGAARRFQLANGMRVVFLPVESPLPVVTAVLQFAVGTAHDPPAMLGLAEIAARELQPPVGTQRITGWTATFDAFARIGIVHGESVDADTTRFLARGLAIHQDFVIHGLERMVRDARYFQGSLEDRQRRFELSLRRRAVLSEQAVDRALAASLFGERHPYALTAGASATTRGRIGVDETRAFAREHYSARNATLILAGAFDAAAAEAVVRRTFGGWDSGHQDAPVRAPAEPPGRRAAVGVVGEEAPQVHVHVAFPAPPGIDDAYAARLVLVEMLDRRAAEVRERLGASYGVRARYRTQVGPGTIDIGGAVDGERGAEALLALRESLAALRAGDKFLEDFVLARRAVLEERLADAGDSASLALALAEIAAFDLPPGFADDLARRVARLGPRDVMALVRSELDPAREVIVCEGTRAALAKTFAGAGIEARIVEP
jgi:zinc protease